MSSEERPQESAGGTLFLVDAMALFFRAHFAFAQRPLATSRGLPTGALYGFLSALLALIRDERAEHLVVALDAPGKTFRHERYAAYKAHRPEMPADLALQVPYLHRLIEALGLRTECQEGVEADDLIASLAARAIEAGWQAVVVSGDKDFGQMIGPRIRQYVPARGREPAHWVDAGRVAERWGVRPDQFVDYLALVGDAIDNVPGIPGIGPKTASQLLRAHGSLEAVFAALDDIAPQSLQKKLREGMDGALASRDLVRLRSDLPVPDPESFPVPDLRHRPAFRDLLRELEFRNIEKRFFPESGSPSGPPPAIAASRAAQPSSPESPGRATQGSLLDACTEGPSPGSGEEEATSQAAPPVTPAVPRWGVEGAAIASAQELRRVVELARRETASGPGQAIAFSLATSGDPARKARLTGIAFGWKAGGIYCVSVSAENDAPETGPSTSAPTDARAAAATEQTTLPGRAAGPAAGATAGDPSEARSDGLSLDVIRDHLGPLFADPALVKAGIDVADDLLVLARHGWVVEGPIEDVKIASYLLDPEATLALEGLARKWLDLEPPEIRAALAEVALTREREARAACSGADLILRLRPRLGAALEETGAAELYRTVEMPLAPVLADMMAAGVAIDTQALAAMGESLALGMRRAEEEIYRLAGQVFNIHSTQQLQTVLFDKLKLAPRHRTKTGFSTSQAVLEEMATLHPLPREVLSYRQLAKLKNTYVDALPRMIDPESGRIHTRFHQTVTATGRLSSSDPNLQNIPIRSALGREIRRAFIAPPGALLISADYSQVELRLLAHLSEDEHLTRAFAEGNDIHRATAALVAGIPEDSVSPAMRARAKTVNFGVIYGMGPQRLAAELGIPLRQAASFIEDYFRKLPGVKAFIDACVQQARERGYAATILGRRRYLPDLASSHPRLRSAAERMAVNSTVQGSAADLIKKAMVELHRHLRARRPGARLLLQVHDELLIEAPAGEAAAVAEEARRVMEAVFALRVPLAVSAGIGPDWLTAHD